MIRNDQELEATQARIRHFQSQVCRLRRVETNPANYRLSASGFLAEIDRMQLEVREYLSLLPGELPLKAGGSGEHRHPA
jgi:hypothetical protein